MSNFKDKLKQSQGQVNTYPKIPIFKTVELKDDDSNGAPSFCSYNKETKLNEFSTEIITGIFIGAAMQMSSYSDSLGRNGGQYKSEHYVNNNHPVSLFAPKGEKYESVFKGTAPEVEEFIGKNSTSTAKKRQVLYVLTSDGIVAVITNLSIAIDQLGVNREALQENFIVLTPALFNESMTTISKKAKEFLGKFRQKNPPKFADITVGQPIEEKDWNYMKADEAVDAYVNWRKFKEKGGEVKQEEKSEQPAYQESEAAQQVRQQAAQGSQSTENKQDDGLDLPF